ncbi:MAG: hypothetical protein GY874_19875 [Desulfobacteraceae bacterium]|nr:hypothetical protein [Desulfobacteraceae bacterium]
MKFSDGFHLRCFILAFAGLALLFLGCSRQVQSASQILKTPNWSVNVPPNWMRLSKPDNTNATILSFDGACLQYIFIQDRRISQAFLYTRHVLRDGMLPHEIADVIVEDLRSDPHIKHFNPISIEPAMIANQPGFKMIYTYYDQQDVKFKTLYYGALVSGRFFNLRYAATLRHYFEKDLNTFERLFGSLHLK